MERPHQHDSGKPQIHGVSRQRRHDCSIISLSLIKAAFNGKLECVQQLLASGVDVNAVDYQGKSSLMRAAYAGHIECAEVLLAAGADVNAVDKDGKNALMHTAGRPRMVKLLTDAGANVNAVDLLLTGLSKFPQSLHPGQTFVLMYAHCTPIPHKEESKWLLL